MRRIFPPFVMALVTIVGTLPAGSERLPFSSAPAVDCGGVYDLCGLVDPKSRDPITPRLFEQVHPFAEGLAGVRLRGRWGWIDVRGTVVVPPRFDFVGDYRGGWAEVVIDGRAGVVDRTGSYVVEPRFSRAVPFSENTVLVREGSFRPVRELEWWSEREAFGRSWRLYDVRTGKLHPESFDLSTFDRARRALIWARPEGGRFYGLLRADGTWQVEPTYERVFPLDQERSVVSVVDDTSVGGPPRRLSGAVDPEGRLVVPLKEWQLSGTYRGRTVVTMNGRKGLVDESGNLIGDRFFDDADAGRTFGVPRVRIDDRWVGIDANGNLLTDDQGASVVVSCPSGIAIVASSAGFSVRGSDGHPTVSHTFDHIDLRRFSCDRPVPVRTGEALAPGARWSFLGSDGRLLVDPPPFNRVTAFVDGHALVARDGKWGLMDETGRFTIEPVYDHLVPWDFVGFFDANGLGSFEPAVRVDPFFRRRGLDVPWTLFEATLEGRKIALTASGEERPLPPRLNRRELPLMCGAGARLIAEGEDWGMVDEAGHRLLPPRYRALGCFSEGIAWAPNEQKRQWCPIGPDGEMLDRPSCNSVWYPYEMSHARPEKLADDLYESSVLWNRALLDHAAGRREGPPCLVGDGVRGGTGKIGC